MKDLNLLDDAISFSGIIDHVSNAPDGITRIIIDIDQSFSHQIKDIEELKDHKVDLFILPLKKSSNAV